MCKLLRDERPRGVKGFGTKWPEGQASPRRVPRGSSFYETECMKTALRRDRHGKLSRWMPTITHLVLSDLRSSDSATLRFVANEVTLICHVVMVGSSRCAHSISLQRDRKFDFGGIWIYDKSKNMGRILSISCHFGSGLGFGLF